MSITIYHNPRCSKSRATLKLIEERGLSPEIIRYLETPPSKDELRDLLALLGMGPRDLLRKREKQYKALGLDDPALDDEALLEAMAAHPILIERPIVVANGRAVIGRPPENVLKIL